MNNTTRTVKYIGFYDFPYSHSDRVCNLAAFNKMNYISSAINRAGFQVNIISPSWMGNNTKVKSEKEYTQKINEKTSVTFCPSWATKNKLTRNIKILFTMLWLFQYLLIKVKKNEKVIAYHVQWISIPIRAAKFIKRFYLILEVEEIYGEVWAESKKLYRMEKKLLDSADSYIFVSDVLKKQFTSKGKSGLVLYGSYDAKGIRKILRLNKKNRNNDNIILVYAGSIDSTKGGATKAVETMRYLPCNYRLRIIGNGTEKEIISLKNQIDEINEEFNKEICKYEGTLYGEEYSKYLLQCDIALNSQNEGIYMNTAFPSKIISYLLHNLEVVSTRVNSILDSSISSLIFFSDDDKPESIANTILNIDLEKSNDNIDEISKLDFKFVESIKNMLGVGE